jgi:glutamyl-tRNA synthetase
MVPDEGPWNGGPDAPYRQSDRKDLYRQYADQLVADGQGLLRLRHAGGTGGHARTAEGCRVGRPAYNAVTREHMKNSLTLSADR